MSKDCWEVRENGQALYRVEMSAADSDVAMDMCFVFGDEYMVEHPDAHIQVFRNEERVFDSVEDTRLDDSDDTSDELSDWSTEELVTALREREGVAIHILEENTSADVHAEGPAIVLVVTD